MEYQKIKQAYNDFRISLLRKGKLPLRETSAGFWGTSVCDELYMIFQRLGLNRSKNFIDLGSGDGRVVLIASLFTKAKGMELDLQLYKKSLEIKDKLGINAEIVHKDFFNEDFGNYDVLFCYPDKPLHYGLEQKFREELKGRLVLYGQNMYPIDLHKDEEFRVNGTLVGVYSNA